MIEPNPRPPSMGASGAASAGAARAQSAVDRIAEAYVEATVDLSPIDATHLGLPGRHDEYDDFSPAGWDAVSRLRQETLAKLADATPADAVDAVTLDAMRERLGLAEEMHAAGLDLAQLNNLASPLQYVRDVLDLMPTGTPDELATFARRLHRIPRALAQWDESLTVAAEQGSRPARRQVQACLEQARDLAGDEGYFAGVVDLAGQDDRARARLRDGAVVARRGYAEAADRLQARLADSPDRDAVGRDVYPLCSRQFLGAHVDLEETYAWGQEELARISAEMATVADRCVPGPRSPRPSTCSTRTRRTCSTAPTPCGRGCRRLRTRSSRTWPVRTSTSRTRCATSSAGSRQRDRRHLLHRPVRRLLPTRPDVVVGAEGRHRVRHLARADHRLPRGRTGPPPAGRPDGLPLANTLNQWRRLMSWTSGHGEGWALYAERLMDELGYLDDPGNWLGLLDAQSLRAARVVLDIGVHCGFAAPAEVGGGEWTYDKAWAFLIAHATRARTCCGSS